MEGEPFSLLHTGWQKKCILDILYDSLRLQPDQEYKKKKGIRESEGIASLESYHSVLSTATKKKKKNPQAPNGAMSVKAPYQLQFQSPQECKLEPVNTEFPWQH